MSVPVEPMRLRFVVQGYAPSIGNKYLKVLRGRVPTYTPLLIALDAIVRIGVESSGDGGSFRVKHLQRGRPKRRGFSPRDVLFSSLAKDWAKSYATVEDYWDDVDHFDSVTAEGLVAALLNPSSIPTFALEDIGRAVREHYPANRRMSKAPMAADGMVFNLMPYIRSHRKIDRPRPRALARSPEIARPRP